MRYYKVKQLADNLKRIDGNILVRNELYTEREKEKFKIKDCLLEAVEIPKNKTYFFFGARFAE